MKICVGCDHRGLELKNAIAKYLREQDHEVDDVGTYTSERTDYPIYGEKVGRAVAEGRADRGIVVCGTGFGISTAAAAIPGVRAVCCSDVYTASMTRRHNSANVLAMGSDVVGERLAFRLVDAFLGASFEGGKHSERLAMLAKLKQTPVTGKSLRVLYKGRELTLYNQRCLQWTHPYEYKPNPGGTLKNSGCGIFSLCEAVEKMSGLRLRPEEVADFSCKVGGRGEDGTDRPVLLKGVVESGLSREYGFRYDLDGHLNDHEKLWECLAEGGAALCNLRIGHIVTLIDCRVAEDGERQILAMDCHSESMDERVRANVREVVPDSLITYPVENESGLTVGYAQSYGMFWLPLEAAMNFDLLHTV